MLDKNTALSLALQFLHKVEDGVASSHTPTPSGIVFRQSKAPNVATANFLRVTVAPLPSASDLAAEAIVSGVQSIVIDQSLLVPAQFNPAIAVATAGGEWKVRHRALVRDVGSEFAQASNGVRSVGLSEFLGARRAFYADGTYDPVIAAEDLKLVKLTDAVLNHIERLVIGSPDAEGAVEIFVTDHVVQLESLAVRAGQQKNGLGTELASAALAKARSYEPELIFGQIDPLESPESLHIHEVKFGFERIGMRYSYEWVAD